MTASEIHVDPEVADALADRRPVVALETAVLTHGLPRIDALASARPPGVEPGPLHLASVRAMAARVRAEGGLPAVVGILGGCLYVGMTDDHLEQLAESPHPKKASVGTLAAVMASGADAGTTVSATLAACVALPVPPTVFATGGIGGVHPGWTQRPDVSADLAQLARSPLAVVCSGAKSILDLPATVEALETLGVPVLGLATDAFPCFHAAGRGDLRVGARVEDVEAAAAVCRTHWTRLGQRSGVLVTNPVPSDAALDRDELDEAVSAANAGAPDGAARTPAVLDELARLTGGRSLRANVALLVDNARVAARLAVVLARG